MTLILNQEEFNQQCVDFHIEATVQSLSNPGNLMHSMRVITFRNFSDETIIIHQQDSKKSIHNVPAKGTTQIMMGPDENLPTFERAG